MIEYNLPTPVTLHKKRSLCWHPALICDRGSKGGQGDNFSRDFEENVEEGFTGTEVSVVTVNIFFLRLWGNLNKPVFTCPAMQH